MWESLYSLLDIATANHPTTFKQHYLGQTYLLIIAKPYFSRGLSHLLRISLHRLSNLNRGTFAILQINIFHQKTGEHIRKRRQHRR